MQNEAVKIKINTEDRIAELEEQDSLYPVKNTWVPEHPEGNARKVLTETIA